MKPLWPLTGALFVLVGPFPRLLAQPWTLVPSSLSCTMESSAGSTLLPECYKTGISYQDDLTFSVTAVCESPCGSENLPLIQLEQDIGQNGVCDDGVGWLMNGGVAGTGSAAYVWGNFNAQSTLAIARLAGSMDCNGVHAYTGPIGMPLPCT
jgi:hypothetical protein